MSFVHIAIYKCSWIFSFADPILILIALARKTDLQWLSKKTITTCSMVSALLAYCVSRKCRFFPVKFKPLLNRGCYFFTMSCDKAFSTYVLLFIYIYISMHSYKYWILLSLFVSFYCCTLFLNQLETVSSSKILIIMWPWNIYRIIWLKKFSILSGNRSGGISNE